MGPGVPALVNELNVLRSARFPATFGNRPVPGPATLLIWGQDRQLILPLGAGCNVLMKPANPRILTINGGSSRIKFALFEAGEALKRVFHGAVERIGHFDATL